MNLEERNQIMVKILRKKDDAFCCHTKRPCDITDKLFSYIWSICSLQKYHELREVNPLVSASLLLNRLKRSFLPFCCCCCCCCNNHPATLCCKTLISVWFPIYNGAGSGEVVFYLFKTLPVHNTESIG